MASSHLFPFLMAVLLGAFGMFLYFKFGLDKPKRSVKKRDTELSPEFRGWLHSLKDRSRAEETKASNRDNPARRWPVEADDTVQSFEGLPHHESWLFGRVTERISPTRVMVQFDSNSKPVRRRISRLVMVRKNRPMSVAS